MSQLGGDDSLSLGALADAALFLDAPTGRILANPSAVALLGDSWQECAEHIVEQALAAMASSDSAVRMLRADTDGDGRSCAVHLVRAEHGSTLFLLEPAELAGVVPAAELGGILESISDCFFALDSAGCFAYANSRAADFFGMSREELLGKSLDSIAGGSPFAEAYRKTVREQSTVSYNTRLDGKYGWIEVRAYPLHSGMLAYFSDITDRVADHEQLAFYALHDQLTRLPNRRYLQEELVRAVAKARRGRPSTLMFMDMDGFKGVNDTVGHAAGDIALVEFAGVVCMSIREEDLLARFGGDEFALILDGITGQEADGVAERIEQAVIGHEFRVGDHVFRLGVSIGIADVDGTIDEGRVMALADDAMYRAKGAGGEQVCRAAATSEALAPEASPVARQPRRREPRA